MKRLEYKRIYDYEEIKELCWKSKSFFNSISLDQELDWDEQAEKYSKLGHFIACFSGNKFVGFVSFYANDQKNKTAWFSLTGVHPKYRSEGVASKLRKMAERISYEAGMRRVRLEVLAGNIPSISLCKKAGFEIVDYIEPNTYIFSKDLKPEQVFA